MEEELWLLLLGLGAGGVAAAVNRRVMKVAAVGYMALTALRTVSAPGCSTD